MTGKLLQLLQLFAMTSKQMTTGIHHSRTYTQIHVKSSAIYLPLFWVNNVKPQALNDELNVAHKISEWGSKAASQQDNDYANINISTTTKVFSHEK